MALGPRCALHPLEPSALACARCGAFTCDVCTPAPSLLCRPCQERLSGGRDGWAQVPRAPSWPIRGLTSPAVRLGGLAVVLSAPWISDRAPPLVAVLVVGLVAMALGIARLVQALLHRRGRANLRTSLAHMRAQRVSAAAVLLEETLRTERLGPAARALALWLHAACASSLGHHARARASLEPLTPSPWRDIGTMRLLRGPGQIVLAVTRALDGDAAGAAVARAAYAPTWAQRLSYAPAYGDALLALRAGRTGAAVQASLEASRRHAARVRDDALASTTALLAAFHAERLGARDAEVEAALAPALGTPREVAEGLAAHWPELRAFVERRLLRAGRSPANNL